MAAYAYIEDAEYDEERRAFDRTTLNARVEFRSHLRGRETSEIKSLSTGGCAVEVSGEYLRGSRVSITIVGFESFVGEVAWQRDSQIGVKFYRPLHQAVVDHIAQL